MSAPAKKSYFDMAKEAIGALKERTGSSSQAIKAYIASKYPACNFQQHLLRAALKKATTAGKFVMVKASYKLSAVEKKPPKKKVVKKVVAKKPAAKKAAPKKAAAKKAAPKKAGAKKAAAPKKAAAKKAAPKKAGAKPAKKAAAPKKAAAKKAAPKKKAAAAKK
jgi:hypothetical protein